MSIRLDSIYREFKVTQRPVWDDENSYTPDRDSWSYRRWAWEFLRRNAAYQAACKDVDRKPDWLAPFLEEGVKPGKGNGLMLPDLSRNTEVARGFGRCELKWFGEEYRAEEDNERLWLAETVTQLKPWRPSVRTVEAELENGQVAIMFDLSCCQKSGQSAQSSLLAHAKEILARELEAYDATLPVAQRSKGFKVRRKKLFLWLRLHDAVEHAGEDRERVAEVLYESRLKGLAKDHPHRMLEARKRISADLKRANEMVEKGYLGLIPLDSIQNRSGRLKTGRK